MRRLLPRVAFKSIKMLPNLKTKPYPSLEVSRSESRWLPARRVAERPVPQPRRVQGQVYAQMGRVGHCFFGKAFFCRLRTPLAAFDPIHPQMPSRSGAAPSRVEHWRQPWQFPVLETAIATAAAGGPGRATCSMPVAETELDAAHWTCPLDFVATTRHKPVPLIARFLGLLLPKGRALEY